MLIERTSTRFATLRTDATLSPPAPTNATEPSVDIPPNVTVRLVELLKPTKTLPERWNVRDVSKVHDLMSFPDKGA